MKHNKVILYSVFLLIIMEAISCASVKTWVYPTGQRRGYGSPIAPKDAIVVLPFDDARQNDNFNGLMMYMIPLLPFGWSTFQTPEAVTGSNGAMLVQNHRPTDDYAKALAKELENSELFREAFYDVRKGDAKFVILGNIVNTEYHQKMFGYGISIYGPLLWFLGAPATYTTNNLVIEYAMVDVKTKKILFEKHYQANEFSKLGWIYSLPSNFNYPEMLKEVNTQFVKDLVQAFPDGIEVILKKNLPVPATNRTMSNFSDLIKSRLR